MGHNVTREAAADADASADADTDVGDAASL